jgi:hypothetical protein
LFSILWGTISSIVVLFFIKFGIRNQFIFSIKDLIIYLYAGIAIKIWLNRKKRFDHFVWISIFLFYLACNWIIFNRGYPAPINNIRQIVAPLLLLFIFTGIDIHNNQITVGKITRYLCLITIVVFMFGIFEQIFRIWEKVDLTVFFQMKNIPTANGVPYMFYESMFQQERMTSVLLDPISLGHFFATVAGYLFYLKDRNKIENLTLLLSIAGVLLSVSKGSMLQFGLYAVLFNKKIPLLLKIFSTVVLVIVLLAIISEFNLPTAVIFIHINGFINSIKSISLFGHGIGSAGNYSGMFSSNRSVNLGIGDTYIGSLIGQTGIFGTLFWLILACSIIYTSVSNNVSRVVAIKIFVAIFLVSVLSENTMNITSFLLPSIIIGLCVNTNKNRFGNADTHH